MDPTIALKKQEKAPQNLVFLAQAKLQELSKYKNKYIRDESDGSGVPVYVLDTGANRKHDVSFFLDSPRAGSIADRRAGVRPLGQ